MENTIFDSKNPLVKVIVLSAVIAAVVGGVFGYYAATFNEGPGSVISTIVNGGNPVAQPASVTGPESESALVTAIVKQYSPAVVSIVASQNVTTQPQDDTSNPFCDDPTFRQFFDCNDSQTPQNSPSTQSEQVAAGTGFIVDPSGLIVTNRHVVDISGATFEVVLNSGKSYPAQVVATDTVQDLALIKINATGLPTVKLGDSSNLEVGETVIAIGNALGQFSNTVSKGIISGLARTITAGEGSTSEQLDQVIQTDAAINPGNSGGPLIDLNGNVIGVNTAIVSGAQNLGFALPINYAKKDITDVQSTGKISYPFLGVQYVPVTPDIQQQYNLSVSQGALVIKGSDGSAAVVSGSPADKAGIKEGDVIISIDGKTIDQQNSLGDLVQGMNVGDTVTLVINRAGTTLTLKATLVERPQ